MTHRLWHVFVVVVVLGAVLLAPTWETLFGALAAIILNRVGRSDWRVSLGLRWVRPRYAALTILGGLVLFFVVKLLLQPLCDLLTHSSRNLHSFDRIRGCPRDAAFLIAKTMLLAGLCEEIIFRGTVQQRLRIILRGVKGCTLLSIVGATAIFTAFHWYQGPSGLLLVALLGLFDCTVYAMVNYTLTYTVILHLVYDTLALLAIAANYDLLLQHWGSKLLELL